MKIPSTSDNLVRSKLCAQMMFSQDDEVEGRKDFKFLYGFPFFRSHTTNVESETVEGSNRGGGRGRYIYIYIYIFLLLSTMLDTGHGFVV